MDEVRLWIPVIVSIIVVVIGFLSWQTARLNARIAKDKLAPDLFDRRMKVFKNVRLIVSYGGYHRIADPHDPSKDIIGFDRGLPNEIIADGRFVFGDDMLELLKRLHMLCVELDTGHAKPSAVRSLYDDEMLPLFNRYMRMESKPAAMAD